MSIAGGIHLACERGREVGANVIQVFSKNQRQWKAKPLSADDIKLFRAAMRNHMIRNLASTDRGQPARGLSAHDQRNGLRSVHRVNRSLGWENAS